MRIAFVGKGGAGKTTLAALFARYLAGQGKTVLAIDADINQHLAETLGLPQNEANTIPPLDNAGGLIKEYLMGKNPRIHSPRFMMKTTPPGRGSKLVSLHEKNNILKPFWKEINCVKVMRTGPLGPDDIGINCFHGKVTIVETLLNHLADRKDDYVIVDMTAGADAFSSGLFTKFDVIFMVAEAARKSFDVYAQFKEHGDKYGINIKVIGNKVESPEDEAYVRQRAGNDFFAAFGKSEYVKSVEREGILPLVNLEKENSGVMARMRDEVDRTAQDWDRLYQQNVDFHRRNAETWMNARMGTDLSVQIDPEFSMSEYVKEYL